MDVMETFALIQNAYIAGIRNAPAMALIGLRNTSERPRRCAFCGGSDFIERIETDLESENDCIIEDLVCEDCGMPAIVQAE